MKTELSRKRKALFGAVVTIAVLGLLEVALKVAGVPEEKRLLDAGLVFPPATSWGVDFERDRERHWKLKPGNDRPWELYKMQFTHEKGQDIDLNARVASFPDRDYFQTVTWEVNDLGLRGPPPDPKKPLVLFVGSSFTFGWGVRAEDSFAGKIRARLADRGWDVGNAGVPGYSSWQSRVQLDALLKDRKPAVVVIETGINDGVWSPGTADDVPRPEGDGSNVLLRSHLLSTLFFLFNSKGTPDPDPAKRFFRSSVTSPNRTRVSEEGLRANLDAMRAAAKRAGARVYFVFPGLYNEYGQKRLLKAADITLLGEIPCVSAFALSPDTVGDMFLPYDEAHLSVAGHAKLADLIWQRFESDDLFSGK